MLDEQIKFINNKQEDEKMDNSVKTKIEQFLTAKKIDEAENLVDQVKNPKDQESLQRLLTAYFYEQGDQKGVFRIIEKTKNFLSQAGRIKKYNNHFGATHGAYNGKIAEKKEIENPKTASDFFKNALHAKRFNEAKKILFQMHQEIKNHPDKTSDDYTNLCKKVDHRESELINALIKEKNYSVAQEIIDSMIENPHNTKHKSKTGRQKKLDDLIK